MTALTLPRNLGRKRQSKPVAVAKGVAKTWTSIKLGSAAARTAKTGAKAYGSWKVTKFFGRRAGKVLLVPIAVGGGVAAWRAMRSSNGAEGPAPFGSASGPAASAQTVTAQDRARLGQRPDGRRRADRRRRQPAVRRHELTGD